MNAKEELKRAGLFDADSDYTGELGNAVLELLEVFNKQGHSGASAALTVQYFSQLAMHKPLVGITGEDDEWYEVGENQFQNNRLSSVFKEGKDGKPYYLDAITWRTQTGSTWSGTAEEVKSRQFIRSFPFMPKTFVIDVIEKEVAPDDWEFTIKDRNQLIPVFEYYA